MNANNDARPSRSAVGMPRWVAAMIVLQALTLAAAFGLRPEAAPAEAAGVRAQDRDVLPNAAGQRAEQIRLLKQIADEMGAMNDKLDRLNRTMEENRAGTQPAGN